MRAAQAIWRFLSHPALSVAGNLSLLFTLGPFVVAVLAAFAGRILDQPVLFLVAIGLALLGLAVAAANAWRQHSPKSKGLSPAERRKSLDDLLYPPRDDRRELGEECARFAMKIRVFNEEQEWKRERTIAHSVQEIREADADVDPFQARKDAESHFERNVETTYALALRDEALLLFDEAREQGAIAAKARITVERPPAFTMSEIPHLFVAIARRLTNDPNYPRRAPSRPPPADLADQLDSLMRQGIDLVDKLSASVEPEKTTGGWKLEGGNAPDAWWDKADDFAKRIRELLIERHPALLTDYRNGYNAHVREERKKQKERAPAQDKRSDAQKMLDLANFELSGPKRVVEASLEGLAVARHRLASPAAASI
jgi:hypothetical protein